MNAWHDKNATNTLITTHVVIHNRSHNYSHAQHNTPFWIITITSEQTIKMIHHVTIIYRYESRYDSF